MSFFGNGLVKNGDGTDLITRMNFGLISEKKNGLDIGRNKKNEFSPIL